MVDLIDRLKGEYAARSRGRVLERLLQELLEPDDAAVGPFAEHPRLGGHRPTASFGDSYRASAAAVGWA